MSGLNPYFVFWLAWIGAGVGVEVHAIRHSHRTGKGVERVDTLSRFTQWLVRAHQGDVVKSHLIFLAAWGLLAAWFPVHILA